MKEKIRRLTSEGEIRVFSLVNGDGSSVELSNVGAGITAINVPDRNGVLGDIVLGYADYITYLSDDACAGKTPGRFANRIAGARFALDGREYVLDANDGLNSNHGGFFGFQNRIWNVERAEAGGESATVSFSLLDPDGSGGYPGNLRVHVSYSWNERSDLLIEFVAETDAPTVVNLTNHVYFNLDATQGEGVIDDHMLQIFADRHLTLHHDHIPGEMLTVEPGGTFDFRKPRRVGHAFSSGDSQIEIARGYNHAWALPMDGGVHHAARLHSSRSGRSVDIFTDHPAILLYTGGWLDVPGGLTKTGAPYRCHSGIALECQNFPDAPSRPDFPSAVLRPGETYRKKIIFKFSNHSLIQTHETK